MATRFYFQSEGTPYITPTGWWHRWDATGTRAPLPLVDSTSTVNTPHASGVVASPFGAGGGLISIGQWVSPALSGQTISGTVSGTMRCGQFNFSINSFLAITMYVVDRNGNLRNTLFTGATGIQYSDAVLEAITTLQQEKFTNLNEDSSLTLTPTTVYNGDSLVVEIGYREDAGTTGSVHIYYGTMDGVEDFPTHNGTLTTARVPWISFSHDFSFYNPTLSTNLISYWSLNEASGLALDYHGNNNLVEVGTISQTNGKVGTARDFQAANAEYFNIASNADVSTGDIDFTFVGWIKPASLTSFPIVANKGWTAPVDSNNEWILYVDSNDNNIRLEVGKNNGVFSISATNFGALSTDTWYFLTCWHDAINNEVGVSVNNIVNTTTYPSGINSGTGSFQIGASSTQSLYFNGPIDECGFWKRVLTSGERTALYNGGTGRDYSYLRLNDSLDFGTNLVSYWGMNEKAGGAIDYHGLNTLLQSGGTIGEIAGKLGGCRAFAASDTECFEAKDNSDLSTGDIDFTFAAWARADTFSNHPIIAHKGWNGALDNSEWALYYHTDQNRFTFSVAQDPNFINLFANNLGVASTNTWYFVVGWHDSVNNEIGISVNDIPPNITGYPSGITNNANKPFQIGASTSQSLYWDGRIDDCAFWKRVVTREEILNLYYSASGRNYDYIVRNSGHDLTRNLISYWPLDEASGNAIDVHGSNTLTDNNTVGTGVGKVSGARDFEESNSEYFSIADNPSLSAGDNDICMCAWLYFESLPAQAFAISKTTTVNVSDSEYLIQLSDTNLYFTVVDTAQTNFFNCRAINFGAVNTGTWYFVCGWRDATNDTLNIEINNEYIDSISYHLGIADTNSQFNIGGLSAYWDGKIDEVGFWKRNLNGYERKLLYNNGNGRNYTYISSGIVTQSSLIIPKIKIIGGIPYFAINKGVW